MLPRNPSKIHNSVQVYLLDQSHNFKQTGFVYVVLTMSVEGSYYLRPLLLRGLLSASAEQHRLWKLFWKVSCTTSKKSAIVIMGSK